MAHGSSGDSIKISFEDLRALLKRIFLKAGAAQTVADILADNCAACERDGCHSHGIFRMPGYVTNLETGWVDGRAVPTAQEVGPSFLRIDARNGFAQPSFEAFRPQIGQIIEATGVAVVAINNSHHFSALWPELEPFAQVGFVGISVVTGGCVVVPPGGRKRVLGTNPIAFATPVGGSDPLIFDFATSNMSHGDLTIAAGAGRKVPYGTGVDRHGRLSDDPVVINDGGGILPFGGHKGAALSLMVEVLASALTGGKFAAEVDFTGYPEANAPKTGQLLIFIDPRRGGNVGFSNRVRDLLEMLRHAGQERFPSQQRYQRRAAAMKDGIPIRAADFENLEALAIGGSPAR
ncbi:delta1-piperideine-2-carboxylate reductase [Sinorhizobium kostiense]|uniref:Delta1-piperideine-2-carboxylate reductase n=1 Tax=Sinorhizobium kostiense TaxID=76747 RepID=A0ABS4R3N1_9HYPH|nr:MULTISPECIES: Ldh family oxidoreductase [Sinorhizobium]MBP2236492.1 delta1-piperideine-2-carboxylate reductase [Sinorhizobium kostiense]